MRKSQSIEEAALFDQADIRDLLQADLQADDAPCVSIYVNTRPETDEKDKNRILYKDRVGEVVDALDKHDIDKRFRQNLVDQLELVGQTDDFWLYQQYGLAVFLSSYRFKVRKLMRSPGDLAVVGGSFHLRPLLSATQHWMRYQVLCIDLQNVALYDCDRERISPVPLHSSVPQSMAQVVGSAETAPSHKDSQRVGDDDRLLKEYFQAVDQAVHGHHNGRTNRPLLLATVSEYQGLFREVSRNPNLLQAALERNPFHELEQSRLGQESWNIVAKALETDVEALVERYWMLEARQEAVARLEPVAHAAAIGQVETLLVDEDCRVSGWVDDDGSMHQGEPWSPRSDDAIDDIAELVLRADGDVRFLPAERMPSETGVAATLRYPLPGR